MTRFDTDRFTAELSPDFEGVVRALEQSIAQARSGGRPIERLSPVHVLVPSPQWEEALSRELAHQHGAEGNLRFRRLEPFVRDVVRESLDPDADGAYRLLGGDEYTNLILREFVRLDESGDWGETSLDACRRYIDGQESELELGEDVERVTRARRRYQLADEVGGRFYQYSVSRPEIFEAWAEGRSIFDGAEDVDDTTVGIEEWQRALWCRTVGDDRQVECEVDGRSQTFVTLPRAVELIEASEELEHGAGDELGTAPLFAVGFPAIGRSFLRALAVVADRGEGVRLFGLDPARAWTGGVDGESSGAVGDICEHWSDVGRVTAGVFEDVTGESPTWEGSGDDRSDDTTLERVRDASTEPDPGDRVEAADVGADERPSIRFDGAPNPHREVEIAANRIWQLLHEEDELRPADVAVAVPSSVWASYLSLIRSIFPAFERLPFAVHAPLGHRGSRVLRAVEALLELTEGRFHRNSMLPVLTHPNVGGRLAGSVSDWREWVDSLGIVDGGDARDHESTYVSGDRLNWRQGARRLALGTVLSRAESDDPREHWDERAVEAAPGPFDDAQTYPAEYVPAGGIGSAAGCLSLARSLIADVRWLTGQRTKGEAVRAGGGRRESLERWGELLADFVDTYVGPVADGRVEYAEQKLRLDRIEERLRRLSDRPGADEAEVGWETARLAAGEALEEMGESAGESLVEGVVVGTPDRLRGLPFEHVFCLGMGDQHYPAQQGRDALDLRRPFSQLDGQIDYLSSAARDRWHFLELLTSARSSLTLSWVDRDATSGEPQPASPVMSDLDRVVDWSAGAFDHCPPDTRRGEPDESSLRSAPVYTRHPLHRWERRNGAFQAARAGEDVDADLPETDRPADPDLEPKGTVGPVLHPQAIREARADALREALEDEAGLDPQIDDIDAVERAIAASVEATGDGGRNESPKLATDWSVHLDDGEPDEYGDDVVRVRLSTLAKYLKTPFQTAAQYRAGLRDEDDDPQRYEPFEAGSLDTAIVTRSVYESVLRDGFPADINSFEERKTYLKNQYEKEVRRRTASGDWPIEVFGAQTRKRHKSILEGWEENRAKRYPDCISPPDPGSMTVFEFGPGPEEKSIAPIELDLRDHSNVHSNFVELFGKTHLATREERNLWELVSKNTNSDKGRLRRYSLEAYIEHLALITEGFGGSRKFVCLWGEAYSNGPGKLKSVRVSFDNIGVGEARRTLKGIVCDYLEGAFHKLAPWGCVRAVWDGEYEDMEEAIDDNNDRWNTPACEYGPVENWEDYPVLDNEEISGIVNRRFKHHPRFKEQN